MERALEVEITDRVGYERHQEPPGGAGIRGMGQPSSGWSLSPARFRSTRQGILMGASHRRFVNRRQRRFEGSDDGNLALYSRGLSTREIEAHIAEIHGVHVGRDLISRVTDAVMEDVVPGSNGRWMTSIRSCSSMRWS